MTGTRGEFAALWISQALSQFGTSVSTLAYPLLVLELTESPVAAGAVGAVTAGTAFLTRLPGGALADRFAPKAVMLLADLARATVVAGVAAMVLTGTATLPLLLLAVFAEVALGAAFGPAEFSLVRLVVAPAERALAVGRMQSRAHLAGLLGPAVGGGLYAIAPALPFAVDAASYLLSFLLVLLVASRRSTRDPATPLGLLRGWRWLRGDPFLLTAGLWTAALTAVFGAVGLLILVVGRERGASPEQLGIMYSISAAGGLVGALCTPLLQRRLRPRTIFRAAAVLDLAATAALIPLESPNLIGLAGAIAFFLAPAVSASLFGQLSLRVDDDLVGSAQATLGLIVGILTPFAPLVIGVVLQAAGAVPGIVGCAAAFAVLAVLAFALPGFRRDRIAES